MTDDTTNPPCWDGVRRRVDQLGDDDLDALYDEITQYRAMHDQSTWKRQGDRLAWQEVELVRRLTIARQGRDLAVWLLDRVPAGPARDFAQPLVDALNAALDTPEQQ